MFHSELYFKYIKTLIIGNLDIFPLISLSVTVILSASTFDLTECHCDIVSINVLTLDTKNIICLEGLNKQYLSLPLGTSLLYCGFDHCDLYQQ